MSAIPYSPQAEKRAAPYSPQDEMSITYAQQTGETHPTHLQHTKENITAAAAPINSQTAPIHPQNGPTNPHTILIHPQTAPVYSSQHVGYVVRPGAMVPAAQHFTPPTGATQDWQHGMCGCFDNWKICTFAIDILDPS